MMPSKNHVKRVWSFTSDQRSLVMFTSRVVARRFAAGYARRFLPQLWTKKDRAEFFANAREDVGRSSDELEWQVQLPDAEMFDKLMDNAKASNDDDDWLAALEYADVKGFEGNYRPLFQNRISSSYVCGVDDVKPDVIDKTIDRLMK